MERCNHHYMGTVEQCTAYRTTPRIPSSTQDENDHPKKPSLTKVKHNVSWVLLTIMVFSQLLYIFFFSFENQAVSRTSGRQMYQHSRHLVLDSVYYNMTISSYTASGGVWHDVQWHDVLYGRRPFRCTLVTMVSGANGDIPPFANMPNHLPLSFLHPSFHPL